MEFLALVLNGPARPGSLHGRPYLVVPMTLVVPGVLNGSQGPLYYPADELSLHPEVWDGMPLVGYHPMRNGLPASARNPEVLERQGLGFTFNSRFDQKLVAEGWFDLDLTGRLDQSLPVSHRIIPRLRSGKGIELSTGLFHREEAAPEGATFNGVAYRAVARAYRPDHVAVLPDAVGACSIKDGCGVLINHKPVEGAEMPLTPEQKKSTVDFLVANCSCWKKPGDVTILNSLPDDKLEELKSAAEKTLPKPPDPPANPLLTPENIKALADALRPHLVAPAPTPVPTPAPAPAPVPTHGPVPAPTIPIAQPVTGNQWLETAPPEIKAMLSGWRQMEIQQKQSLVDRLVSNVADVVQRQATHTLLMNRTLPDLQLMAALLPPTQTVNGGGLIPAVPLFTGAPGGAVPQGAYDPVNGSDQDLLLSPTINWNEGREGRRQVAPRTPANGTA